MKYFCRLLKAFSHAEIKIPIKKNNTTIFALSSGFGKCGIAVVRVSGPDVKQALLKIGGFRKLPPPREAKLRKLSDPVTNEILDQGLVLWFPGPCSFTGEDSCEFQIHGGTAVISAVLQALGKLNNFFPAEPGEFTKRAFYSGKMDLTSVEGLSALIDSETEIQRKQAFYQMEGALYALYSQWSERITKNLAHIEAYIDFDEDQDIDEGVMKSICTDVNYLVISLKEHLKDGRKGERVRKGVEMTILGAPNSGKSSLMNILCKRPAAIVSPIPGTTRDLVQTHMDINGYPINVTDTAGLRLDPTDQVEAEGITRAFSSAVDSDLILFVFDVTMFVDWAKLKGYSLENSKTLQDYLYNKVYELGVLDQIRRCSNLSNFILKKDGEHSDSRNQGLIILNKIDLISIEEKSSILKCFQMYDFICGMSCINEDGLKNLLEIMNYKLELLCGKLGSLHNHPSYSNIRQRHCIEECLSSLEKFNQLSTNGHLVDLAAEELRGAICSLGKLTGKISTEKLLDIIFRDFCIGK